MEMVCVEGGSFLMGSESGDLDEQPLHGEFLENFEIGKYQVTQSQWLKLFKSLPHMIYNRGADLPITEVSWYEAINFCIALSVSEGLELYYSINKFNVNCNEGSKGYRLPSEAEWEFAARGGLESKGYLYSGSNRLDDVAWYVSNSGQQLHSVGQKEPNELGLFDMSGNVYEYCWDEYGPYGRDRQRKTVIDSDVQAKSHKLPPRVMRGGNCYGLPYRQRNTSRYKYRYVGFRHDFIGFRVARSL